MTKNGSQHLAIREIKEEKVIEGNARGGHNTARIRNGCGSHKIPVTMLETKC
jgi:hypothetical protein